MPDLYRLIDAFCEAYDNPHFKPRQGMTFCNQAVQAVSERMGYKKFKSLLANRMVALMRSSSEWVRIPIDEAQSYANEGHLVVAGQQDQPHGHVVVVRPGVAEISRKWGGPVPKVINVGADNFIGKGLNWAFKEKPEVFLWREG
ncbi:MAG: hypothetical protein HY548_02145 [Elusimicrobia bacterium]|nr:hypothetical protein [Elusimicrobiota bacterium]